MVLRFFDGKIIHVVTIHLLSFTAFDEAHVVLQACHQVWSALVFSAFFSVFAFFV